jgi:hypothetical protein
LATPEIKEFLAKPFRVDYSHTIPLTGGSNRNGRTYYEDRDVPVGLRKFILWHERTEKAFRSVLGMNYSRAHTLATCAERVLVEAAGRNWEQYKREVAQVVRHNEIEPKVGLPPDLDRVPMKESG